MRRAAATAAALLAGAGAAYGDGISGVVEGDYTHMRGESGDVALGNLRNDLDQFTQRYRLTLDRAVLPLLRVNVGGIFEQYNGTSNIGGIATDIDSRTEALNGLLQVGSPMLGLNGGYTWREQTAATLTTPYGFVSEEANVLLWWRPAELPWITLLLTRPSIHDRQRLLQDITTPQVLFNAGWDPTTPLQLRYTLDYQNPNDHLHGTETTNLTNFAQVLFSDSLPDGRASFSTTVQLRNQQLTVLRSAAGGQTFLPVAPIAGLSLVEQFPATPAQDTLVQNPALINADFTASAGLDIGTAPSFAGDVQPRDVGVQFADAITSVNTLWLWVDKQLPPSVGASLDFTVWASNDNQLWTPIQLAGPVVENAFEPRFEVTIPETQARYLKLVVKPLAAGATVDPQYRNVFITELQTLNVTAAPGAHTMQSSNLATASANARAVLLPKIALAYDVSAFVSAGDQLGGSAQYTYDVTNGLSFSKKLNDLFTASARVARHDGEQSGGHLGEWLWSASMASNPLPGLSSSVVYGGRRVLGPGGLMTMHNVSLFGQATPWRGIGLLANLNLGITALPSGQNTDLDSAILSTTLQPHPSLTLAGTVAHSTSVTSGADLPRVVYVNNRFEATATFSPVRALYLSGGVQRIVTPPTPVTLGNAAVSFSPFSGGDLQLGLAFNETLEPDGGITRLFSPSLRWSIKRAIATLTYTWFDSTSVTAPLHTNTLDVNLRIPL